MSHVTYILSQIEAGDPHAAEALLPLVYEELRKLAAAKLAHENPGQTLQATALVHEAYLRLAAAPGVRGQESGVSGDENDNRNLAPGSCLLTPVSWNSRGHFFAAAAEAMRRILVEQARRKQRLRHGGDHQRVDLDSQLQVSTEGDDNLLALDEALERLMAEEPAAAQVVKLRYFAGLTIEETALAMNISVRTANRHWAYARAWLHHELH